MFGTEELPICLLDLLHIVSLVQIHLWNHQVLEHQTPSCLMVGIVNIVLKTFTYI